jgi:NTE family protein
MKQTPLDRALDAFRIRQYFNAVTMARELAGGIRSDASFLRVARRALLTLPHDRPPTIDRHPFPSFRKTELPPLRSRRVALLTTGGSGALACLVGAARAFEEADIRPTAISVCSGAALFGFPIAAGRSADEVAEITLGLTASDLVDVDWRALLTLLPRQGQGFNGLMRGDRIEAWYRKWLGDMTLAELPIPAYAPVWDIERNRVEYIGPRTHPRLAVARAVRMAIALPLFIEAVQYRGHHYWDGGTADILPVRPLLDIETPPDVVIAINGFYPKEFDGEDITGWLEKPGSILYAASQVREIQHIELARENLARLRREVPVVRLISPVPYEAVRGVGLYRQFLDNTMWPDFMRAGLRTTRRALRVASATPRTQPTPPGVPDRRAGSRR